jgi:hypothetical protein
MCAAPTLAGRFAVVVTGLRAMLAAYMVRADHIRPVLLLFWRRLGQLNRRIATLAERFAAGRSVAPRRRAKPNSPRAQRAATPRLRLPTKPGWLLAQTMQAAPHAAYFRQLLENPEMLALIEAAPHLKQQLRPILRLLLPELPPSLALPPKPVRLKPPRPPRPKKPRRAPCHGARRPKEFWRPGPIRPHWTA